MDDLNPRIAQQLEQGINQGVVDPTLGEVGATLDMSQFPIIAPDANMDRYLSDFDSQIGKYFDTLGCNIFSSVGALEMYINALGGDPDYIGDSGKTELSERKVCVDAGLNGTQGSSEAQWEQAINTMGDVRWDAFPWDVNTTTLQEFFSKPTPDGSHFLAKYQPFHRAVGTDLASIGQALKYGAVKIFIGTGTGFNLGEPNVIPKTNNPMGHAVLVRYIDGLGIHIRDQYAPYLKCLAPDYIIYYAFQTLLKRKDKMKIYKDIRTNPATIVAGFEIDSPENLKWITQQSGLLLPLKPDGTVDFDKVTYDGQIS